MNNSGGMEQDPHIITLDKLNPGLEAEIVELADTLQGAQRRRLLDMGMTPGTTIRRQFDGPGGEPSAFLVRNTTLALRKTQSQHIRIRVDSRQE